MEGGLPLARKHWQEEGESVILSWSPTASQQTELSSRFRLESDCWACMKMWWSSNHGNILHTLLRDGCIDVVRSFYFPEWLLAEMPPRERSNTFLDAMIQWAAWNEGEYHCCGPPAKLDIWRDHVLAICELHRLSVPMSPIRPNIWSEGPSQSRPCPACWHGIIGLAVGMDATSFRPFTWGADDDNVVDDDEDDDDEDFHDHCSSVAKKEFAQMLVKEREESSFYVELAISAMDWELHAPELRMLDRYRSLGGTTRVGHSTIVEFLPQVVQVSSMYTDADEALHRLLKVLNDWKRGEDMWSDFMTRSLASKIAERCAQLVLEFVLGAPRSREGLAALSCFEPLRTHSGAYASHEDSAIEAITHAEPPAIIFPAEAAEIAQIQWAQFVEARREHVFGLVEQLLPASEIQSSAAIWVESGAEMPPARVEWTTEAQLPVPTFPVPTFGDTVYMLSFTRAGRSLQTAVEGSELETVRAAILEAGHTWKLQSGAKVLLYRNQYSTIHNALDLQGLRPHHVLIADAFLPLLLTEIRKLPSRANVRPSLLQPAALVADEQEEEQSIAIVKRTFYNLVPANLVRAESVTQSVHDARDGTNPRRRQSHWE